MNEWLDRMSVKRRTRLLVSLAAVLGATLGAAIGGGPGLVLAAAAMILTNMLHCGPGGTSQSEWER